MVENDQRFEEAMMLNRDEEGDALLNNETSYPIWSPFDAQEAASVLLAMLNAKE